MLIRGGTTSVGLAATVLAKQQGLTVSAITRNPEHEAMLLENGRVIRVGEKLIYDRHHYERMVDIIIKTIQTSGSINVAQLRDQFNTSRKYAVSFLEHLDQIHVTRRIGDDRVLR